MVTFMNLTPHRIRLNNGTEYPPSGICCRVEMIHSIPDEHGIMTAEYGPVIDLPDPEPDVIYIVSAIVAIASRRLFPDDKLDLVSPATGHPDCIRWNGQVVSVPGFIRA